MMIESILNAYAGASAYEVIEDLKIVADRLGGGDEGWRKLGRLLGAVEDYVGYYCEIPTEVAR